MANTRKELPAKTVILMDTMEAANDVVTTTGDLVIGVNDQFNVGPAANISGAVKQVWNAAVPAVSTVVFATSVAGARYTIKVRQVNRDAQGAVPSVIEQLATITMSGTTTTDAAALEVALNAARAANGGKLQIAAVPTGGTSTVTITASAGYELMDITAYYQESGTAVTINQHGAGGSTNGELAYNRTNEIEDEGLDTDGVTTATVFTRWSFFIGRDMGRNGVTSDDVLHRVDVFADKDGANYATFLADMDTALGT